MGGRDVEGGEGCVVGLEEPERGLRGGGVGADVVVVEDAVVGGNLRCSYYGSKPKFDYWAYPAGGNPTRSLQSPPEKPVGQSISIAP